MQANLAEKVEKGKDENLIENYQHFFNESHIPSKSIQRSLVHPGSKVTTEKLSSGSLKQFNNVPASGEVSPSCQEGQVLLAQENRFSLPRQLKMEVNTD